MAWPSNTNNIITTALDSATDDPSVSRSHLKDALDEIKNIINGRAESNGVASLDSNTLIPAAQIPNELNSSSGENLTLDPATGIVVIEDVLKLNPKTKSQLNALTVSDGSLAFCSDEVVDSAGATGMPCYYRDGFWRRFSDNAII